MSKIYNHNFKDGQIVRDIGFNETFIFSDKVDGFRAQETEFFRLANEEEIKDLALLNLKNVTPIVREFAGFIVLAQDEMDFKSKITGIARGDRKGYFTIEMAAKMKNHQQ